jgi:hypothetical protein
MYDRSEDSKANREPGQDYLTFHYVSGRLAFAVCDGVGGSFLGNLAAQFLGEHLVEWLWEQHSPIATNRLKRDLSRYLLKLTRPASHFIENYRLPSGLPPLVHEVLEEQRAYGSEAMFVSGRIEWPSSRSSGQVALAWLGDAELQVYDRDGHRRALLSGTVAERWSTSRGLRGELHTFVGAADGIARVIGYSDGLHSLTDDLHHLPDRLLARELMRLGQHSLSDDLSLVDIALDEQYIPAEQGVEDDVQPPKSPSAQAEDRAAHSPSSTEINSPPDPSLSSPHILSTDTDRIGSVLLRWMSVSGAEEYRVQMAATADAFERTPLQYVVRETQFKTMPLRGRIKCARVQALAGERSGSWSKIVPLGDKPAVRPSEFTSFHPARPTPSKEHPTPDEADAWEDRTPALNSPIFLSPPDDANINTGSKLTWSEISDAEFYTVQQATDRTFAPDDVLEEIVSESFVSITEDDEPGVYYYRVQAGTANARSAWSRTLRVRIRSDDLTVPADGPDSS